MYTELLSVAGQSLDIVKQYLVHALRLTGELNVNVTVAASAAVVDQRLLPVGNPLQSVA